MDRKLVWSMIRNGQIRYYTTQSCGGLVASWLVCLPVDRAVQVRALARDIVLCSWARHFTLTVSLSTQVYKWVPANLVLVDYHPIRRMEDSCYGNRDKLWGAYHLQKPSGWKFQA